MVDTSLVSASTTIRGNISGQGSLRIEGKVRGDISVTGDVVLGPLAQVAGSIQGAVVTVEGAVEGDISASVALSVGSAARVVGDLTAPNIGLEEGALVRGRIETEGTGAPAARSRVASASVARPAPTLRRTEPARPTVVAKPQPAPVTPPSRPEAAPVKPTFKLEPKPEVTKPPVRREVSAPTRVVPSAASVTAETDASLGETTDARVARKQPPPPVVSAPRKGAKGRKKAAKRE